MGLKGLSRIVLAIRERVQVVEKRQDALQASHDRMVAFVDNLGVAYQAAVTDRDRMEEEIKKKRDGFYTRLRPVEDAVADLRQSLFDDADAPEWVFAKVVRISKALAKLGSDGA